MLSLPAYCSRLSRTLDACALTAFTLTAGTLIGCATTDPVTHEATPPAPGTSALPVNCSALPPVQDIWQLEDMLLRKGTLTADMSREQREAAIRKYLAARNAAHLEQCKGQLKK